jgi:hypothetical protein
MRLEFPVGVLQMHEKASAGRHLEFRRMIVSHKHKIIFIKPRKVAGTSFEIALSKYLDDKDIITPISRVDEEDRADLGFQGPSNFNFGFVKLFTKEANKPLSFSRWDLPLKFYNHIPAAMAKRRLDASVWRDYRKVSIVRNPWDRAISIFFWKNTKPKKNMKPDIKNFTSYFRDNPELLKINYPNYMIKGNDVIDTYIRFENFEQDILALEKQVPSLAGLWDIFSQINAKSDTRDPSRSTPAQIFASHPAVNEQVEKLNAWEINRFSYRLSQ